MAGTRSVYLMATYRKINLNQSLIDTDSDSVTNERLADQYHVSLMVVVDQECKT